MPDWKTCTGPCGRERPLDDFPRQAASRDGRKPRCRDCEAAGRRRQSADRDRRARGDARYAAGFRDGAAEAEKRRPPALSPDVIRDAITLAHPDRHPPERRQLATRVTAELNALREAS